MPHSFDLDWEELQTYQGINPKPADHGAFWEATLAELEGVAANVKLTPADFCAPFADCFHMTFTGLGGASLYAKVVRPINQTEPGPAVVMFHGYSWHSGSWLDKLPYAAAGITVVAFDCRGQGGRSHDNGEVRGNTLNGHIVRGLTDALDGRPEQLYYRQTFADTAHVARLTMGFDFVDETRVGVTGASQGGALAVACAALVPEIKFAAPIYPFLADYQRVWEIDLAADAYGELTEWFRRFDPQHKRSAEVFTQLGYVDIQHLASKIQAETVWYIGLSDKICPPSSQFAAYNKIEAPKRLEVYPDFAHEDLPGANDQIFQLMLGL